MGYVDVSDLGHALPDGRVLLTTWISASAREPRRRIVGANGAGKTTLLRLIAGDLPCNKAPSHGSAAWA